jgi:hypothetical protein
MVPSDFHAAFNRRIGSEVLLRRTQAAVLDRGASVDDEGDRRGPTIGRLLKGILYERARCLRRIPLLGKHSMLEHTGQASTGHFRKAAKRLREFPTRY